MVPLWRSKKRPTPEQLVIPDDVAEAIALRKTSTAEIAKLEAMAPFVARLTSGLIDRRDRNHYIELLYQHARGTS